MSIWRGQLQVRGTSEALQAVWAGTGRQAGVNEKGVQTEGIEVVKLINQCGELSCSTRRPSVALPCVLTTYHSLDRFSVLELYLLLQRPAIFLPPGLANRSVSLLEHIQPLLPNYQPETKPIHPSIMAPETSFFQNPGYKRSFTDVPLDGDKIATKEFIEACESLTVIFEYLSAAFSVVSKDINGNITVCIINKGHHPSPWFQRLIPALPHNTEDQDTFRGGSQRVWHHKGSRHQRAQDQEAHCYRGSSVADTVRFALPQPATTHPLSEPSLLNPFFKQ